MADYDDAYTTKLALFQRPYVKRFVEEIYYVETSPKNSFDEGKAIEFQVNGNNPDYVDLSKSRLKVKAKITKEDGSPIAADNSVAFVNLTLHSLFRQVDLLLQNKIISPDISTNYGYKAILDVLLHYGFSSKESQLQSELYFKDIGNMDAIPGGTNGGIDSRDSFTRTGENVALEGPLHLDICQQERPLLNGINLVLKLYQHNSQFLLMTHDSEQYKVKITSASFKICYVKVTNAVRIAQNDVLKVAPSRYPFWKSSLKTFTCPKGEASFKADDMFHGHVPTKLIVGMVKSEAYNGSYRYNPFNFVNERVNFVQFTVNGNSVPQEALQPNFATGDTVTAFLTLFYNKYPQHKGNFITRNDYANGYSLFVFDIQGEADQDIFAVPKESVTKLTLRFAENLNENITIIAYGIFPATLYCDYTRSIWWE